MGWKPSKKQVEGCISQLQAINDHKKAACSQEKEN
jgi:hypothetical protein